jgi:tetratricopeptide (TPR) repeat protein
MRLLRSLFAAVALLGAIISAKPVTAQDHMTCEKESGDIAIAACDRAIASGKLTPSQLAWTYHNRAVEYETKGKHELALADYDRALTVDAKRPTSLVGRGNALSNLGKHQLALDAYNQALRILPDSPNTLQNRALNYVRMKDYKRARDDYERAIALPARGQADRDSQAKARSQLSQLPNE